jgi:hypothetical protein
MKNVLYESQRLLDFSVGLNFYGHGPPHAPPFVLLAEPLVAKHASVNHQRVVYSVLLQLTCAYFINTICLRP